MSVLVSYVRPDGVVVEQWTPTATPVIYVPFREAYDPYSIAAHLPGSHPPVTRQLLYRIGHECCGRVYYYRDR